MTKLFILTVNLRKL